MGEEIYYIEKEKIFDGKFLLSGDEGKHCLKVKRNQIGDRILLTDGEGKEYEGKILRRNPKRDEVFGEILRVRERPRELEFDLDLAFAPLKNRDLTFLIEKASELGVRGFIPVKTERTVASFKRERLEKVARQGIKTALGTVIPKFYPLVPFFSFLSSLSGYSIALLGYEKEEEKFLSDILPFSPREGRILLIIGPEGGFSDEEIEVAKREGILTFSLGKRRLAAGTAALSALSIIIELKMRRGGE